MKIIALISFVIYMRGIYKIQSELFLHNKSNMDMDTKVRSVGVLIILLSLYSSLLYWLYMRKGFETGFSVYKFEDDLWLLLVPVALLTELVIKQIKVLRLTKKPNNKKYTNKCC